MTKKLVFLSVSILILTSATSAFAQTDYNATAANTAVSPTVQRPLLKTALKPLIGAKSSLPPEQIQAFKDKIAAIQDLKKKTVVERINTNIATMNTNLTNTMTQTLARLTSTNAYLKTKSAGFKAQGKNTTNFDSTISSAETAIATANTAVTTQSQKQYTAEITSDTNLRAPIGQMVSTFRQDITTTYKTVAAAKAAVLTAIAEAKKINGENSTATSSGGLQ